MSNLDTCDLIGKRLIAPKPTKSYFLATSYTDSDSRLDSNREDCRAKWFAELRMENLWAIESFGEWA